MQEKARQRERKRNRAIGSQFAPSSWLSAARKALSRGCSFGQCLLFLPRSLLPQLLVSFSLSLPFIAIFSLYRLLAFSPFRSFSRSSRSPLSFIARSPPASTPVLHRAHETRVPAKSLCHLANRPSAARIIPRCARSRGDQFVVPVGTPHRRREESHESRDIRYCGSAVTFVRWLARSLSLSKKGERRGKR